MTDWRRFRFDDLRRYASALVAGAGMAPTRASLLAAQRLWFDGAGAPRLGIASLIGDLARIEAREIDPVIESVVVSERGSTAALDGRGGVPLLALLRAAELAGEKARETGLGLVRVRNIAQVESAAGIAADLATGPVFAAILGPGSAWSVALPTLGGLPAVFDPMLAEPVESGRKKGKSRATIDALFAPWAGVLAPEGGWIVAALAVGALEPTSAFQERVSAALNGLDEVSGRLLPELWEQRRREVREQGVAIEPDAWSVLAGWGERLGVAPPTPMEPLREG